MITQVKTFIVDNPIAIEQAMNEWLVEQKDIEVHQIYPILVMNQQQKPCLMFILTYTKEGWR